jgi:uncharacterized protein YdcH (DUF465 family)
MITEADRPRIEAEHRELDRQIAELHAHHVDVVALKKRRLKLKSQIARLDRLDRARAEAPGCLYRQREAV